MIFASGAPLIMPMLVIAIHRSDTNVSVAVTFFNVVVSVGVKGVESRDPGRPRRVCRGLGRVYRHEFAREEAGMTENNSFLRG
jgi:hypothetical protein